MNNGNSPTDLKPSAYDRRQASGFGWQDHGPVLLNHSPRAAVGKHFIGPLEAIIWIATRDMDAIRGAMGYVACAKDREGHSNFGVASLIVLDAYLPGDVSGHHLDCPANCGAGQCDCEQRGRQRYCRCEDASTTEPATCFCVKNAKSDLIDAIHEGMRIFGREALGKKPIDLHKDDPGALIDMQLHADSSGLRLIPSYADDLLAWPDILARWPANFSDKPIETHVIAGQVPGEPEAGRPARLKHEALTIFVLRARQGMTKWPAAEEARRIAASATEAKNDESIGRWIRPYYRHLFANKRFNPAAVLPVTKDVEADLEAARLARVAAAGRPD